MRTLIELFVLSSVLCGCGEDAPASKSNSYVPPVFNKEGAVGSNAQTATDNKSKPSSAQPSASTPAAAVQPAAATPAKDGKKQESVGGGIISGAAAVIDYGTGATPLTIKKKQTEKIRQIEDQHNKNLNRAIKEN